MLVAMGRPVPAALVLAALLPGQTPLPQPLPVSPLSGAVLPAGAGPDDWVIDFRGLH